MVLFPVVQKPEPKKNNWSYESYKFDEVFSESASQKRVYEEVAKPMVEASHAFQMPLIN
jgi:kinesin family member 5